MRLQDFIIGLMAFIVCSMVILDLTFNMYSPLGFDIDLNEDNVTKMLGELQTKIETQQNTVREQNEDIWSKTVGQTKANVETGSLSEADLAKSSLNALTNIGNYVVVFTTMISAMFEAGNLRTGTNDASPLFWFFTSSITIIIGMILISSVLKNWL